MPNRKKTSIYISEPLLRAVKALAAAQGRKEYELFEEALRRYLGLEAVRPNWEGGDVLTEEDAMRIARAALEEVRQREPNQARQAS